MSSLFHKAEAFYEKYERHISSFALVGGFIFDNLTIQRIDLLFDHVVIVIYLIVSGGSIALLNYYHEHPPRKNFFIGLQSLLPFVIQFAFGGLFSVFLVFYGRNASFAASWPFLLVILFLLIGNEFFREYYHRLTFQISIYFVAVFSFAMLSIPVLMKSMSVGVFIFSGIVSLIIIYFFSLTLFRVVPKRYKDSRTDLQRSILAIFVVINFLYFSNLIPPIPLALKHSGVYYSVEKIGDDYNVVGEKKLWYEKLTFFSPATISLKPGSSLYIFSSVFAPTNLKTNIVHDWQYFDEATGKWVSVYKITFAIVGGRDGGYRTFSKKDNVKSGKWRVDIETERGQIIGRMRFNAEINLAPIEIENKVL